MQLLMLLGSFLILLQIDLTMTWPDHDMTVCHHAMTMIMNDPCKIQPSLKLWNMMIVTSQSWHCMNWPSDRKWNYTFAIFTKFSWYLRLNQLLLIEFYKALQNFPHNCIVILHNEALPDSFLYLHLYMYMYLYMYLHLYCSIAQGGAVCWSSAKSFLAPMVGAPTPEEAWRPNAPDR